MSILEEIKNGENKKIQFKSIFPKSDNIIKTAIAFSNCAGGKLIIGVEDNGNIIGVSDDHIINLPDKISNIIYDACYPTIIPEIYTEAIKDKNVLIIEFYPGNLKPYYIKSKQKLKGTYVRVGATNKLADENIIFELERQKRNISFDEEINYGNEINEDKINKLMLDFSELIGRKINKSDLINLRILKENNGALHNTNAGILLAEENVDFDYAKVMCARFKGIDSIEFIDSKEFRGPLYKQVIDSINFIKIYIEKHSRIEDVHRTDSYSIPIVAIREALINAIVHRDYTINGSSIKVAIFDDRMEIISPGSLPKSLDVRDIKIGRSEVRNKVIARVFKEIGYIEQWGTGIRRIIELCKNSEKEPEFIESGNGFKVILYKNNSGNQTDDKTKGDDKTVDKNDDRTVSDDKTDGKTDDKNKVYKDREKIILEYIKENGFVTTSIAKNLIGLKDTATKTFLKKMVDNNLIKPDGTGKYRKYILL